MIRSILVLCCFAVCFATPIGKDCPTTAHVNIQATLKFPDVKGYLIFKQESPTSPVKISGEVTGLPAGLYGFHVHQVGNITGGDCLAAGPHFNPAGKKHGSPKDENRHVGDLGNIEFVANDDQVGVANIDVEDNVISLCGENAIVDRAVVVHAGQDDLGLGRNADSGKTGNAGPRAGCGIIQAGEAA